MSNQIDLKQADAVVLPASCTLLGVTTLCPQVYTSPSDVSTTVWRFAAATAVMPLPCIQESLVITTMQQIPIHNYEDRAGKLIRRADSKRS